MAQKSQIDQESDQVEVKKEDNLVKIKSKKENQVLEINKQMKSVEDSISKLDKKLNQTNKQIKTDINQLTQSDAEITDRVTQTYKQLGVIEGNFQDLNKQSTKISSDLKKLNNTIQSLEKSSEKALNEAIDTQSAVNDEFRQTHADLIQRAEKLSKKATTISSKITKSIKENSQALAELEAKIVTELETIASNSEQRASRLDDKIQSNTEDLNSQKAKLMLMQSVDEALDKRASALETTSAKLIEESANLKKSSEMLDVLTAKLSADVEALELHTAKLAQQNIQQQGFIESLHEKTSALGQNLLALATLEKKHFRYFAATSLLLILAIVGLFVYGEYMRTTEFSAETQRNVQVESQVGEIQSQVRQEQVESQKLNQEIATLQTNITEIQQQMQGMNDQVESLDGRVQYLAPLYNFGSDNTIHGSQWMSQLDPEKFSIKIATVSDKQQLYDIAQRYNHYFKQELAYFANAEQQQFTLIYGGDFDSEQQVSELLRRMPTYMNGERIAAISNAQVLQQIQY